MGNKRLFTMFILSTMMMLIVGCNINDNPDRVTVVSKISDLAYSSNSKDEPLVYLKESEGYCPYLVLTNDYNGKTLLLRKETLSEYMRISDYYAYYEDSEMDKYLNGEFIDNLPKETRDIIEKSKIEILDEECLDMIEEEVVTISRKVFLLSVIELGYDGGGIVGKEGSPLAYFDDDYNNRLAYYENSDERVSWWLRSANSVYDSCVCAVGPSGELGSTNAFSLNGVRPAFCVNGNLPVHEEEGKYVISTGSDY